MPRFFFSTFVVGVPTQLAVVVILSANAEFKTMRREIIPTLTLTPTLTPTLTLTLTPAPAPTPTPTLTRREIKDGQYGPLPQFVANQLVALPMLLLISVCVLVPPYLITDLPWASFGPVLLMYTACMWAFEGMAMYFSLTDNPIVGMALYVQSWFATYPYPYLYPYPYPSLSPYPYPYPYPYP